MSQQKNITAFILSGGSSSRMGKNKALLKINGKYLIQLLVDLLDTLFTNIIISSNNIEQFKFTGKEIVKDIFPGKGPLAGIHACLKKTNTEKNFFLSCDTPFISAELINYLCDYQTTADIIIPEAENIIQKLCGLYSKNILSKVEAILLESSANNNSNLKGSIFELLEECSTKIIDVSKLKFYNHNLFFNMNTPKDYEYVKSKFSNK